ncbi:MAG: hypothetical protein IPP72_14835 [Chitinophagaceae bacterium]|nr:hypothetical protein [Chitinophagaceae bacterium]
MAQEPDVILNTAETRYMQEKMYIHTDKSIYSSGETVWFKAYIAADNLPLAISKTVFAELINDKGMVLQRKTMPLILSGASADFILPDTLPDTRLFIRAYTGWMLNFDSSLLYVKPIQIIPKKGLPKKAATPPVYSVTFFPEGGDLVEGVESHVAFKATDMEGTPVFVKGEVLNNKNKSIVSFTSLHDGMGFFILQPLPGETYKAVWKDKKGKQFETMLPAVKKDGVVLTIGFPNNQLHYSLTRPDTASPAFLRYTVVAQMQQRMLYGAQINLTKKNAATAPIPTDSMPDGVLQITVFNAAMVPVAERLVFVNNNNYSFITDLHLIEKNIIKRGRNVIQVDVGGTLLSNLSVSVTDGDINPVGKNEENIYSQLLMSSDLKGYVYNPAYYFSSDDDSVKQHLDLVMMTNGWRRFKWENLLADQWPVLNYQPEDYLAISGKVIGLARSAFYGRNITGILQTKTGNKPSFFNIPINEKGDFYQSSLYFFDTAKLYYQFSNDKDKSLTGTASFSFKNSFIKAPLLTKDMLVNLYLPERIDSSIAAKTGNLAALRRTQLAASTKVQVLDEVGGDGYTFTTEDDPFAKSSPGVLAYLQGKVAGLQISMNGQGSASWRGSTPSFFLNENPSDIGMLQSVNMNDVAMIKVFRPPFMGAAGGGAGGAIAVYTKKGVTENASFKALPSTNIFGYSAIREFYSPDYSVNTDPFAKDYRTTLYWNGNIYIDKNVRRITLPFYNSDNCKKLRVIVEGLNELGQLTREEKIFE